MQSGGSRRAAASLRGSARRRSERRIGPPIRPKGDARIRRGRLHNFELASRSEGRFLVTRHRGCGGEAEVAVRCTACGEQLSAREVEAEPGPGLSAESRLATT